MSVPFPAPTEAAETRTEVYLRYLAYFRDGVVRRVEAMSEDEARRVWEVSQEMAAVSFAQA